jgi:hypothetical protein
MLAMLLGALAPAVAQAVVASQGGVGWVQVCSASGMVWVKSDGLEDPAASKPMADASRHCPWCSLQGSAGLPPEPSLTASFQRGPAQAPATRFHSATPSAAWPAALSRAPPRG